MKQASSSQAHPCPHLTPLLIGRLREVAELSAHEHVEAFLTTESMFQYPSALALEELNPV